MLIPWPTLMCYGHGFDICVLWIIYRLVCCDICVLGTWNWYLCFMDVLWSYICMLWSYFCVMIWIYVLWSYMDHICYFCPICAAIFWKTELTGKYGASFAVRMHTAKKPYTRQRRRQIFNFFCFSLFPAYIRIYIAFQPQYITRYIIWPQISPHITYSP